MVKLLFIICLSVFSIQAFACPSRNFIFLIHGVGGSNKTFGSMEKYLNKFDECFVTTSFSYDTGNSKLSTYDFAQHFAKFLMDKIRSESISRHDKISLVMHSQGGIVGSIWLNMMKQTHPEIHSMVDSFITLSTPYWGADMADIGKGVFYTLPPGMENPIAPFGRIELNEMSFGSATIRNLLWSFLDNFSFNQIRRLAMGGLREGLSLKSESDHVVPIYSSRPDHYRGVATISLNDSQKRIEIPFNKTKTTPFITVPAAHIKMDLGSAIAELPKECGETLKCNHPAIDYITSHLKGRSIASVEKPLKNFRVNIYVNNNSQEDLDKNDIKVEFIKGTNLKIMPSLTSFRGKAQLREGHAFSLEGSTSKDGQQILFLRIRIKNKLSSIIEIPVEGGYSSLLNLKLVN